MTRIAIAVAYVLLTGAVVLATVWLRLWDREPHKAVDWVGWWFAVAAAYAGLTLVSRWVLGRERARPRGR